jgi:hypothetical protein
MYIYLYTSGTVYFPAGGGLDSMHKTIPAEKSAKTHAPGKIDHPGAMAV